MLVRICKAINIDVHFKGCRRRGGGTGEICMFHSLVEWFDDGIVYVVLNYVVLPRFLCSFLSLTRGCHRTSHK